MEKLATDTYSFERLRKDGYVYVDKTAQILPLADKSIGTQFFLARPRRFGKSLLVSTLHCLFEGRRELFEGLAIEDKWDWSQKWPVLHLDMGSCQAETIEEFWVALESRLKAESRRLNVPLHADENVTGKFACLLDDLAAQSSDGQVVLLVDEYDKPLLGHLSKGDVTAFRDALKQFYSVIKMLESKQRFTFLTGVSKFSKVSIFSDLNNLRDQSMTTGAATLLGYTHDELKKYFPETLQKIAAANGWDVESAFNKVIEWYDGYRFEETAEKVINPVSFGLCAENGKFQDYWSRTAMPTFLIDALKIQPLDFSALEVDQQALDAYEPTNPCIVTLMYQTGYLTIKSVRQICDVYRYRLDFPNREVSASFLSCLAPIYAGVDRGDSVNYQFAACEALYTGDVEKFFKTLRCFFANIPYSLTDRQNEQMWQAIVYVILKTIGIPVKAEIQTNEGRIDMTCETPAAIWLIEFKLDHPAEEALAQIERNNYAAKYDLAAKPVVKAGISFSSEKRTITDIQLA